MSQDLSSRTRVLGPARCLFPRCQRRRTTSPTRQSQLARLLRDLQQQRSGVESGGRHAPLCQVPLNDRDKQDVLFQTAENVCKGLEKVPKDDYHAYVSHTFPSHTRSQPFGRFVHISFVTFAGILPPSPPGTCFFSGRPTLLKLWDKQPPHVCISSFVSSSVHSASQE